MKDLNLPFERVTVRAIILRREDGALLGVLHRKDGSYAPPGGGMEPGETPEQTVLRELEEEFITLVGRDPKWRERIAVDYYHLHREMNIWYVFLTDDVILRETDEILDARWLDQTQDVWYPLMREKILLAIKEYIPDMLNVDVSVLDSW
jgi:8-oxo-dGTP pyrophosphatase MutT (NUDIX family)